MGRHREWRKIAKRERRRRIRIKEAQERNPENNIDKLSEEYKMWIEQQKCLYQFELEEIKRQNEIENSKWLKADNFAVKQWNELQKKLELTRLANLEQEIRIQKEWENEQKRIKETKEKLKQMEEEQRVRQELFMEKLQQFLCGDAEQAPLELMIVRETKPDMGLCPFFVKTACCRFGDACSRNHQYPGISKVLLAPNFYTHFGLDNSQVTEYEDDVMLEYEDSDTYKHFKEFFFDVLPEFEKYGEVIEFKVCHNYEKHLRGNTYIEFKEVRCAVAAYRALHARWYGGKQLSLQFCTITSWNNAICGLQLSKKCPKGRSCNFLHVFRNPISFRRKRVRSPRRSSERERYWRWSPSPEREYKTKKREYRGSEREKARRKEKEYYSGKERRPRY